MELFEEIRREHEFANGSVRGIARKLGVHRRRAASCSRGGTAGAPHSATAATEVRTTAGIDRRDSARGPESPAQTTTHGPPDLHAHSYGAAGLSR